MAKQSRGLPAEFAFEVAPDAGQSSEPVKLESYLDRQLAPSPISHEAQQRPVPHRTEPPERVPAPRTDGAGEFPARPREQERLASAQRLNRRRAVRRPPRMELSLDAETQRKAEEVVVDVREQGPQPDATPSEFARALVQLAHDARHKADYMQLNRRGQWGSATAKAFVADMKEAFLRAIGQLYVDRYPNDVREQLGDS